MYKHQLEGLEVRWNLVLRALRFFYMSLGSFAAAALISLLGSILTVPASGGKDEGLLPAVQGGANTRVGATCTTKKDSERNRPCFDSCHETGGLTKLSRQPLSRRMTFSSCSLMDSSSAQSCEECRERNEHRREL
jgi:hypothetical protein